MPRAKTPKTVGKPPAVMLQDDPLMTVEEVCEALRLDSVSSFYHQRRAGTAPPMVKIGKRLVIRRSKFNEWFAEREAAA